MAASLMNSKLLKRNLNVYVHPNIHHVHMADLLMEQPWPTFPNRVDVCLLLVNLWYIISLFYESDIIYVYVLDTILKNRRKNDHAFGLHHSINIFQKCLHTIYVTTYWHYLWTLCPCNITYLQYLFMFLLLYLSPEINDDRQQSLVLWYCFSSADICACIDHSVSHIVWN